MSSIPGGSLRCREYPTRELDLHAALRNMIHCGFSEKGTQKLYLGCVWPPNNNGIHFHIGQFNHWDKYMYLISRDRKGRKRMGMTSNFGYLVIQ